MVEPTISEWRAKELAAELEAGFRARRAYEESNGKPEPCGRCRGWGWVGGGGRCPMCEGTGNKPPESEAASNA